jgi:WD40 repeat protein
LKPISAAKRRRAEERAYRVFISYKHSDPSTLGSDGEFARWLQRRLETYSFPRKLVGVATSVGVVPARLGSVFRDEDYLPAGPELDLLIERALRGSENLVVLCSPAAAASPWVSKEIAFFKSLQVQAANGDGTRRQVFALIVDGEPHASDPKLECFPPALRVQVDAAGHLTSIPSNPLAPDIRRDGRDNAVLRLVAGLFGLDFEDLIAREEQRRREFRRRSIMLLSLGIVLSALAIAGLVGTAFLGWRNALARSDLIAANAGQVMLDNRTEEGLLIGLSAAPPPVGGVLPLRPAAQQAIATAVLATENLEAVLQDSGLEVEVVKPFHKSPLVLTAGMDGTANLFDVHSGKSIRTLGKSGEPIRLGAVSPDDKLVAVAPTSGPIVVWFTEGSGPPVELAFGDDEATSIEFSPDGRWLVVASEKSVKMWRTGNWSNVHQLRGGGTAMAISPDSTKLVVGNGEGTVAEFAIGGGPALWQKQVHEGSITSLAFASDGTRLVTASLDRTAKLVDAASGKELTQPMQSSGPTLAAAFSPDGGLVATTSTDGDVELFDGKSGSKRLSYPTNAGWTAAIAFSADGKKLAVGSRNRTITVISTPDAKESLMLRGHQGEVLALSFVGSGGELVSGGSDGSIRVWSTVDRRKRCEVSLGGLEGRRIALASAANTSAIQGRDGTIDIFRLSDCTGISVLDTHSDTVSNFAISPDGSELALLKPGGWEVWATASGTPVTEAKIDSANAIALGTGALAVASGNKIVLWSLGAMQQQPRSIDLSQGIRQIAMSPDGQFIGAALADATFAVVRPEGSVVGRHAGSLADAKWIEFSPFGGQALLGNDAGTAMLIRGVADNTPAEPLASEVSTAQFLADNAIAYLSFEGIAHALDAETLGELYTYRAVPRTVAVSTLSTHQSLVSLSAFGDDMIVRNVLPVGLPLVAYGCQIRPIGSERVLSARIFRKLSGSLGQLLPCDTSSRVEQMMRLVTFATDRGH